MDQWYYGKDGQQQGPVDLQTIRSLLASGQLTLSDVVWKEGMANWMTISQVPELTTQSTQQQFNQGVQTGAYQHGGHQHATLQQSGGLNYQTTPGDPTKNGMALTSMILGIVSVVGGCFCFGVLGYGCGIAAIITSRSGAQSQQPGMAKAGLICGIIGIVFGILSLIFGVLMLMGVVSNPYQGGF